MKNKILFLLFLFLFFLGGIFAPLQAMPPKLIKGKPTEEKKEEEKKETAIILEEQGRRLSDVGEESSSSVVARGVKIGAREEVSDEKFSSTDNSSTTKEEEMPRPVRKFTGDYDYYAPDGSRIKKLAAASRGDIAYCTLPVGKISSPVQHKTVEELWCVKSGVGELWLKGNELEGRPDQVIVLEENVTLFIPPRTPFQFRNIGESQLDIVMTTMPCWPGPDEAIKVEEGLWKPSEEQDK
ncbi:MAG: cupin domain-containing protein [Chthoniobacterales bacterium]|nr:cupin domain-containing protein [Chthoniobacterales bacterium]